MVVPWCKDDIGWFHINVIYFVNEETNTNFTMEKLLLSIVSARGPVQTFLLKRYSVYKILDNTHKSLIRYKKVQDTESN